MLPPKFLSQAQRRIREPNCKDCLTVLHHGDAIPTGEAEHLLAIDRHIGGNSDLKLLELATRRSPECGPDDMKAKLRSENCQLNHT